MNKVFQLVGTVVVGNFLAEVAMKIMENLAERRADAKTKEENLTE